MVPVVVEHVRDVFDVDVVVERRGIADLALVRCHFALQAFDQMPDGHTRWNGVWIDDQVGRDTFGRERHVLEKKKEMSS